MKTLAFMMGVNLATVFTLALLLAMYGGSHDWELKPEIPFTPEWWRACFKLFLFIGVICWLLWVGR